MLKSCQRGEIWDNKSWDMVSIGMDTHSFSQSTFLHNGWGCLKKPITPLASAIKIRPQGISEPLKTVPFRYRRAESNEISFPKVSGSSIIFKVFIFLPFFHSIWNWLVLINDGWVINLGNVDLWGEKEMGVGIGRFGRALFACTLWFQLEDMF